MPKAPPVLPEETLRRVLRVARFDGAGMAAVAGLFALVAAAAHDAKATSRGGWAIPIRCYRRRFAPACRRSSARRSPRPA
jgi:hypothetical protein